MVFVNEGETGQECSQRGRAGVTQWEASSESFIWSQHHECLYNAYSLA